jgi:hypothetical protein
MDMSARSVDEQRAAALACGESDVASYRCIADAF